MSITVSNLLQTSDISTSAADFQPNGTAAAGASGRVADAAHVHPASDIPSANYQIVTGTASTSSGGLDDGSGVSSVLANVTVNAPTGFKVVGGGFTLATGTWSSGVHSGQNWGAAIAIGPSSANNLSSGLFQNGPASDGSSWTFEAIIVPDRIEIPQTGPYGWRNMAAAAIPASTVVVTVYAICVKVG